jgi:hypothetical protein
MNQNQRARHPPPRPQALSLVAGEEAAQDGEHHEKHDAYHDATKEQTE